MIKKIIIGTTTALMLTTTGALADTKTINESVIYSQTDNQWYASNLIGRNIKNSKGKIVGDINDLLFDKNGRLDAVVIGVGGFLELGEKNIAIKFNSIEQKKDKNSKTYLYLDVSKKELNKMPEFKKTTVTPGFLTRMKEHASQAGQQTQDASSEAYKQTKELGKAAAEKASEMKDKVMGKEENKQ